MVGIVGTVALALVVEWRWPAPAMELSVQELDLVVKEGDTRGVTIGSEFLRSVSELRINGPRTQLSVATPTAVSFNTHGDRPCLNFQIIHAAGWQPALRILPHLPSGKACDSAVDIKSPLGRWNPIVPKDHTIELVLNGPTEAPVFEEQSALSVGGRARKARGRPLALADSEIDARPRVDISGNLELRTVRLSAEDPKGEVHLIALAHGYPSVHVGGTDVSLVPFLKTVLLVREAMK
jgi:hypothetical protein